jgi:hypothetical protein
MRNRRLLWLFVVLGLIVLAGGAAAYYLWVTPGTPVEPGVFDGERAYADVIVQVEMGPRVPGSAGHDALIEWASASLETAGWEIEVQESVFHGTPIRNLIARRGELDPGAEWILLGAHFDTRPLADRDPEPANRALPVPGANDGASGVSVLLEIARVLPEPEENVWIVLFDAEDGGDIDGGEWIVGSQAFVEALPGMAGGRLPDAVIVVDMIGDAELNIHVELNSSPELVAEIWGTAQAQGHGDVFIPAPKFSMLDDHTPFIRLGIPTALLIDFDYPYWHTVEDTPDKVSAVSLAAVGETLLAWLER